MLIVRLKLSRELQFFGIVWRSAAFLACIIELTSCGNISPYEKKDIPIDSKQHGETNFLKKVVALQTVPIVAIRKERLSKSIELPGELLAFQDVPVHAKVEGYIKWIGVDRGSIVEKGQKLLTIFCPELTEKAKEAEAKVSSAEAAYSQSRSSEEATRSRLVEAQAALDADRLTLSRLQQAARTPGAVAQNEVDLQQKTVEADQARVNSVGQEVTAASNFVVAEKHNIHAAEEVFNALKDMMSYLTIEAPFSGVITERNVHEGSIVAVDAARNAIPLVRIQETDVLRLVVAVPEDSVSGIKIGDKFTFTVPAFVGRTFEGTVARPGYALDNATRTMPVEMNVYNSKRALEPGMFATVRWVVSRPYQTLFVPASAVNSDLKGTFVIKIQDNTAERIAVERGLTMGDQVEVSGGVHAGDYVALKATDEYKTGTHLNAKIADACDLQNAQKRSSGGGE